MHHRAKHQSSRWLWLTMAVPDPPTNGQFLYSKGLIEAATAAGLSLDIIAIDRLDAHSRHLAQLPLQRWWIAPNSPRSRWASIASSLPHIANRTNTPEMRGLLRARLSSGEDGGWDAIVLDSLAAAWGFDEVWSYLRRQRRRPRLLYLAHNHETSLAQRLAEVHPHPIKRQISRLEALKVARLERWVGRAADLITANAPEDCDLFRQEYAGVPVEWLPPAFVGPRVAARAIGPAVPRRAVMLGTFDWLPKRLNLMEFVGVADPLFAAAGIELQVVGAAKPAFMDELRRTVRATTFTGPIEDTRPYLAAARIGIAAERIGGGFKLKALEYVFNRVPIAALAGTIPGVPLVDGESGIFAPDAATLARRIIAAIDDFELLNRLQSCAYRDCSTMFDAPNVGRVLASAGLRDAAAAPRHQELATLVIG